MWWPFNASNVWNGLKGVRRVTSKALRWLWDGKGDPWWEDVGFFIPRVLGSTVVGAAFLAGTTVVAGVGAITAGVIGGFYQAGRGLFGIGKGVFSLNANTVTNGFKDIGKGITKMVVGTVVVGGIVIAIGSGVGAPAIAGIQAIPLLGPIIAPAAAAIIPAVHAGLATAAVAIGSGLSAGASIIGTIGIVAAAAAGFAAVTKTIRNKEQVVRAAINKKATEFEKKYSGNFLVKCAGKLTKLAKEAWKEEPKLDVTKKFTSVVPSNKSPSKPSSSSSSSKQKPGSS